MRSLDHHGVLFDNLNFSNFGYGGDPNDVTRLRIGKNKWYDFRGLFRRDKNFWDYNLFANPLNPASLNAPGSETTGCIVSPPSAAHTGLAGTVRPGSAAKQSTEFTVSGPPHAGLRSDGCFPQIEGTATSWAAAPQNRDEGPGLYTTTGTPSGVQSNGKLTTNASIARGCDFRVLPRTTLSTTSSSVTSSRTTSSPITPRSIRKLRIHSGGRCRPGTPAGAPVDLGNIWSTQTPRKRSVRDSDRGRTINAATPTCNGCSLQPRSGSANFFHAYGALSLPIKLLSRGSKCRLGRLRHSVLTLGPLGGGERSAPDRARRNTAGGQ